MRTITKQVYRLNELSEDAKEHARSEHLRLFDYPWDNDAKNSLDAFARVFPVTIRDWAYGGRDSGVSFDMDCDDNITLLSGVRLASHLWTNYKNKIYKPKYLGCVNGKSIYSKVQIESSCPLTGYCIDNDLLDPILKFMKKPKDNVNFRELLEDCFDQWVRSMESDIEYHQSMEYFEELCEANGYEFHEDGEIL
jgi:hypothetical protein